MRTVSIHQPKTPVTKGCIATAQATTPNVCKMPGPPAPFVPTPLPNTGMSNLSPSGYSKTVMIEKTAVAIGNATFKSVGDIASKGTGGGLISANAHGVTKFIPPGSMTVKIEGKSPHLHGEQMLNNCADGGTPPNTGATMTGNNARTCKGTPVEVVIAPDCNEKKDPQKTKPPWDACQCAQVCCMVNAYNQSTHPKKKLDPSPSNAPRKSPEGKAYHESINTFSDEFDALVNEPEPNLDHPDIKAKFYSPSVPPADKEDCVHKAWKESVEKKEDKSPPRSGRPRFNPDHMHPASLNGQLVSSNMRWADGRVNGAVGASMDQKALKPTEGAENKDQPQAVAHPNCDCKGCTCK